MLPVKPLLCGLEAEQHATISSGETLHDATFLLWASEVTAPLPSEVPWPKKLCAIATLDTSGVDVTGL